MNNEQGDRRYFCARATRNPFFLAAHIPGLLASAARKIRNRLRAIYRGPHLGAKVPPQWLPHRDWSAYDMPNLSIERFYLPIYPDSRAYLDKPCLAGGAIELDSAEFDTEVLFAVNRWRDLCEQSLSMKFETDSTLAELRHWIKQNSDSNHLAWEPYSVCERIANLLVWLARLSSDKRSPRIEEVGDLILFVQKSLYWIGSHLEYYGESGTNNHILNNARALVMGGVAVGDDWSFRAGMGIFNKFLPQLVSEEGFLRERSSHYQLIVANWMLDAWHFVDACFGGENPDAMFLRLYAHRMTAACGMLCNEHGELIGLVGDVSPDAPPMLTSRRLTLLYPQVCQAWAPGRNCRAHVLGDWFRVDDGRQSILGNFPSGTFPPPYPTHGHGDHTGFVWRVGDVSILADPGRYRYTPDSVSVVQKSALGHSVPFVNGFPPMCESMLRNGMWWPKPYASARLDLQITGSLVRMSHNGYARATPVRQHTRNLGMVAEGIEVEDRFEGAGGVTIVLRWSFGAGFDTFDPGTSSVSGQDGTVRLSIAGGAGAPVFSTHRAAEDGGWYSEMYGVKTASFVLEVELKAALPVLVKTCFRIVHVRDSGNPQV